MHILLQHTVDGILQSPRAVVHRYDHRDQKAGDMLGGDILCPDAPRQCRCRFRSDLLVRARGCFFLQFVDRILDILLQLSLIGYDIILA